MQVPSETTSYGAPTQPWEVRCHRCQCSFAPETKRCIHCGEPLGTATPFGGRLAAGSDDDAGPQVPAFARGLLWALSVGAAIVLSALQTCGGVER